MRKVSLLVLTSLVLIAAGMLASSLLMAQYSIPAVAPKITIKLPNGTQDMNVTATSPYDIGDRFNITVWIENAVQMSGYGLTVVWNSTYMNMTNYWVDWNPAGWLPALIGFWTNDLNTQPGPWMGLLPPLIGAFHDLGGTAIGDANNKTGTFQICTIEFQINAYGPHGFYLWKNPDHYAPWPYVGAQPYLQQEGAFPEAVHLFGYCNVFIPPAGSYSNYTVTWSANPYYAPPTPLSGKVSNAMLWIQPPSPYPPEAEKTEDPDPPIVNQNVTVTVTQTQAGFDGTTTHDISNVTIDWDDGSPLEWMAPVAGVATFVHNYTLEGDYDIEVYCYAAGQPPGYEWYNITNPITVVPEFPAYLLMPLFLTATTIAVVAAKIMWSKKPKRRVNVR